MVDGADDGCRITGDDKKLPVYIVLDDNGGSRMIGGDAGSPGMIKNFRCFDLRKPQKIFRNGTCK